MKLSSAEIVALRPTVERPLPGKTPIDVLVEQEASGSGNSHGIASVITVLLRGSECTFRCLMCDLWKSTHIAPTPEGNIPAQVEFALQQTHNNSPTSERHTNDSLRWIKLYNASNFFAPINVPTTDLPIIAQQVHSFDRVIVENHPRLLTDTIPAFASQLDGKLEVAMGLETVDPQALSRLNKQLTVDDVQRAVHWLFDRNIDTRLFVLLRPPGHSEQEGIDWCHAAIAAARSWGVRHVSIIPVRSGNGAIEQLEAAGAFAPPQAASLEQVLVQNVAASPMIVTADLWDWSRLRGLCASCTDARRAWVANLNLTQQPTARPDCPNCNCDCGNCN